MTVRKDPAILASMLANWSRNLITTKLIMKWYQIMKICLFVCIGVLCLSLGNYGLDCSSPMVLSSDTITSGWEFIGHKKTML